MSLQVRERCGDDISILQKEITEVKLLLSLAFYNNLQKLHASLESNTSSIQPKSVPIKTPLRFCVQLDLYQSIIYLNRSP